jgi:hypothetical protein
MIRLPLVGALTKNNLMGLASVPPAVAVGKPKKLLEQTRDVLRLKHYSLRSKRSYCDWRVKLLARAKDLVVVHYVYVLRVH